MTINYKDINLSYQKYGEGKDVIIILPGWGETRNTFLEMINILMIDYTGFKHLQNIKTVETIEKWLFFCQIFVFYLAYNTRTML